MPRIIYGATIKKIENAMLLGSKLTDNCVVGFTFANRLCRGFKFFVIILETGPPLKKPQYCKLWQVKNLRISLDCNVLTPLRLERKCRRHCGIYTGRSKLWLGQRRVELARRRLARWLAGAGARWPAACLWDTAAGGVKPKYNARILPSVSTKATLLVQLKLY